MADSGWQLQEIEYGAVPREARSTVSVPTKAVSKSIAVQLVKARLRLLLSQSSPVDSVRIIDGDSNTIADWDRLDEAAMPRIRSSAVSLID
jgi:hypothetical protein